MIILVSFTTDRRQSLGDDFRPILAEGWRAGLEVKGFCQQVFEPKLGKLASGRGDAAPPNAEGKIEGTVLAEAGTRRIHKRGS